MNKIFLLLMFWITSASIGQNKLEEVLVDPNGKVISKTKLKKSITRSPEKTIEIFYKNQNNIKIIDPLISFRFYQKTPYYKLKEILAEKDKTCGKFIKNTLIKTKTSEDKNSIAYLYNVTYQNLKTIEEIILKRESINDDFQVYVYNIKKAVN